MPQTVALLSLLTTGSASPYITKRTQSSVNGTLDEDFFNTYFGQHDESSTYSDCLTRNLAQSMPTRIGMHFPSSHVTVNETGGTTLAQMQQQNVAAFGDMSSYHGLMDWATVFYVPDLTSHLKQLAADGIPTLERRYVDANGVEMHCALVYTPSSGHVLELQSDRCSSCASTSFGEDECELGHRLPRSAAEYRELWQNVTSVEGGWSTVGPAKLPAPMMVQIKQVATEGAQSLVDNIWGAVTPIQRSSHGACDVATTITGAGPFGQPVTSVLPEYPLQTVFVTNRPQQSSIAPFLEFLDRLHEERVGFGWGWDRAMDFHTKVTDSEGGRSQDTKAGVSLDHWAAALTEAGVRFSAFNLSQQCGASGALDDAFGPSGAMIYTAGPANLGVEFWGSFDYSFFSKEHPFYSWGGIGGCSPTFDCRAELSPPDCSAESPEDPTLIRARVSADFPSNLAYATVECPEGYLVEELSQAHFGTPTGDCATGFEIDQTCDVDIGALARSLCVGNSSCQVPASTALFGDVCDGAPGAWTIVEARCSRQGVAIV